jgi:hypothetical protein
MVYTGCARARNGHHLAAHQGHLRFLTVVQGVITTLK